MDVLFYVNSTYTIGIKLYCQEFPIWITDAFLAS